MTPRRPTYRNGPPSREWHRDRHNAMYWPRHEAWSWTPDEDRAPVLVARHGRTT